MPDSPPPLPEVESAFDRAARRVLVYLKQTMPLEFWGVSRVVDTQQVHRHVTKNPLGMRPGEAVPWSQTLCQVMWEEGAPRIAPDLHAVRGYAGRAAQFNPGLASYVGMPLTGDDGSLLGTLCALDRQVRPELLQHRAELAVLGDLLSEVLRSESRRQQVERDLESVRLQADTDSLTGLLNRRSWEIACRSEQQRVRELGSVAGILVVDLDHLKAVNDSDGHAAGDDHLRTASQALRSAVRPGDQVARLGGDEFGVLLPLADRWQLQQVMGALRAALQRAGVAASIGGSELNSTVSYQAAMRAADDGMYADKRRRHPVAAHGRFASARGRRVASSTGARGAGADGSVPERPIGTHC
ncbi:sensor domain-containing diguanylate cyclase [Nakamurella aerolata]|uniref:Sensor domain-containing diguanylate cyclase n=1 Tax=Nakamurella aerolata TaxID=1656892 RepID=A0A849ACQ0_9ACTN|nr:sensor domain-containing diguanylate cyclase [Nakamurella aerolata]NNG36961.1 sensor domain-containing diguanylate cyclase [Nakamurella aerolata]